MSTPDPLKQAERAALAKLTAEKATLGEWAKAHAGWLIALAAFGAICFIAGHLV